MTNEDIADLIRARTDGVAGHIDRRIAAMQAALEGELVILEEGLQDLRAEVACVLRRTG